MAYGGFDTDGDDERSAWAEWQRSKVKTRDLESRIRQAGLEDGHRRRDWTVVSFAALLGWLRGRQHHTVVWLSLALVVTVVAATSLALSRFWPLALAVVLIVLGVPRVQGRRWNWRRLRRP